MGIFPPGGRLREIVLKVDIPDVLAELEATFEAYERALTGNDIETHTEFHPDGSAQIGRQSQIWIRTDSGWKIVSAHVSFGL